MAALLVLAFYAAVALQSPACAGRPRPRQRYGRYVRSFMGVLTQYDGTLLAAHEQPDVVEGEWPFDKIIMLRFADRAAFDRWAQSPEYRAIAEDRLAATEGVVIVVDALG